MAKHGIGASVLRKEDDRFLRGRGQYVGDIRMAGTMPGLSKSMFPNDTEMSFSLQNI
jgi:CO/xanthine dehydrogenase Mo-binding subunit